MSALASVLRLAVVSLLSPWLLAVAAAFGVAMAVVHDVARVAQRGADVGRRVALARAAAQADAAAMAAWQAGAAAASSAAEPSCSVHSDGSTVLVRSRLPDGETIAFHGRLLAGAAAPAFGRMLTMAEPGNGAGGGGVVGDHALARPALDPATMARATSAAVSTVLRRDPGIALLHWRAGTDGDDFVFAASGGVVGLGGFGDLACVPGHLWVEAGPAPLVVDVPRDLVLVVQGNLYLFRSLEVRGPGRLLLVAAGLADRASFADEDGNGRWSEQDRMLDGRPFAGAIEGAGNVYIGPAGGGDAVACAAGIVVQGQLHLRSDLRCAGPLVLAHGATRLIASARFEAVGAWCFDPEREAVPGFVTTGTARPSRLRVALGPAAARMRDLPLYLAAPAR